MTTRVLPAPGAEPRQVALAVNQLLDGKVNSTGSVTLNVSSSSTTLSDRRIGVATVVVLMPTTLNAATALSTTYITARTAGECTIQHGAYAAADMVFDYALLG